MTEGRPRSYDYTKRAGARELSWEDFAALAGQLTEALARRKIDTVVGIARGGLFPATAVACALRCELYPVRVTRRLHDEVVYDSPLWRVPVSPLVEGKAVAIIDDVCDTGESLALVAAQVRALKAERAVTAALIAHSWAEPAADVSALLTDELVIFPWDSSVYLEGRWQPHPEIERALRAQAGDDA